MMMNLAGNEPRVAMVKMAGRERESWGTVFI
jgi:hypothetical protein